MIWAAPCYRQGPYTPISCIQVWLSLMFIKGFPSGSVVKNLPTMQELQEMWVRSLGREDSLEKGTATHFSILAWETPWTEEPGRLLCGVTKSPNMTEATLHACPHDVYKTPGIAPSKILTWIFPFCSSSLCKTQHLLLGVNSAQLLSWLIPSADPIALPSPHPRLRGFCHDTFSL